MGIGGQERQNRKKERPRLKDDDLPDDFEGFTEEERLFLINSAADMPVKRHRIISLTNALARSAHGLTLTEKRVLFCAIARIDSRKYDPAEFARGILFRSTLHAKEYAEAFDVPLPNAYIQMREAADKLLRRYVTFYELRAMARGGRKKPTLVRSNWVQDVTYFENKGTLEIVWTRKIAGELLALKETQFTKYRLKQASQLRSIYSWRLLELMESYINQNEKKPDKKDSGWFQMSTEEFATRMNATDKQVQDFGAIRRRIIEPAVKDLTEKDGWIVKWKPLKTGGRKFTSIRFEFKRNPQGRLFAPQ